MIVLVDDSADEYLKGCRRRESAAAQDIGSGVSIKAAYSNAHFLKSGNHTANQCSGLSLFLRMYREVTQIHIILRIPGRLQPNHMLVVKCHNGNDVQINRGSQNTAMLVIGMVSADLGSARCRKYGDLLPLRIQARKVLCRLQIACSLCSKYGIGAAVEFAKLFIIFSCGQVCLKLFQFHGHDSFSVVFSDVNSVFGLEMAETTFFIYASFSLYFLRYTTYASSIPTAGMTHISTRMEF